MAIIVQCNSRILRIKRKSWNISSRNALPCSLTTMQTNVEIHKINSPSRLHYSRNKMMHRKYTVDMWMLAKVMLVKILGLKCYWDKYTVLNVLLLAKELETRKTANLK